MSSFGRQPQEPFDPLTPKGQNPALPQAKAEEPKNSDYKQEKVPSDAGLDAVQASADQPVPAENPRPVKPVRPNAARGKRQMATARAEANQAPQIADEATKTPDEVRAEGAGPVMPEDEGGMPPDQPQSDVPPVPPSDPPQQMQDRPRAPRAPRPRRTPRMAAQRNALGADPQRDATPDQDVPAQEQQAKSQAVEPQQQNGDEQGAKLIEAVQENTRAVQAMMMMLAEMKSQGVTVRFA